MGNLHCIDPIELTPIFPHPELALTDPNGLLAVGGDLSPERLITAYRQGIFPWYNEGQPILWWSPDPRWVLFLEQLHISRSLRRKLRRGTYRITLDQDFSGVIQACAGPRRNSEGTWITPEMKIAYLHLYRMGIAHSIEAWEGDELVGGVYGLSIGHVFFGESMFSRRSDASKVAFVYLCRQLQQWGFSFIDCQTHSEHMQRFGAQTLSRSEFLRRLQALCNRSSNNRPWRLDKEISELYRD